MEKLYLHFTLLFSPQQVYEKDTMLLSWGTGPKQRACNHNELTFTSFSKLEFSGVLKFIAEYSFLPVKNKFLMLKKCKF